MVLRATFTCVGDQQQRKLPSINVLFDKFLQQGDILTVTNRLGVKLTSLSATCEAFIHFFPYHLMLGSKDGVARHCAQTGERQAKLTAQRLT